MHIDKHTNKYVMSDALVSAMTKIKMGDVIEMEGVLLTDWQGNDSLRR